MGEKSAYQEYGAKSLDEYVKATLRITKEWEGNGPIVEPWFRGVTNSEHGLMPGFYRKPSGIDEDDLRDEVQRRAFPFLDGNHPSCKWEWYFLMQHYGLPTRLLDWSESSLVGLFFAVNVFNGFGDWGQDAAVWMIDPWRVNKWSTNRHEVFRYNDKKMRRYLTEELFAADNLPKKPAAIMPPHNSRRLAAQRGMFTIHGSTRKPLEEQLPKTSKAQCAKIVIPKKQVAQVRRSLRTAGVTDATMFPELGYLCLDICRSWIYDNQ
jgi:hypothetical protein